MIRFYQNVENVNINSMKTVKVDMKRGSFVTVNATGELALAPTIADVQGILVRGTVPDMDTAMGFPVNMYGDTQDLVKAGQRAGNRGLFNGEIIGTTEYVSSLVDGDVTAGKYLTVTNGKLDKVTGDTKTFIVSEGWEKQDGHKLLSFRILK